MMQGQQKFTVHTKKDKDSDQRATSVTIVWDGCSEEVVKALAVQALIVKRQGVWRNKGIPTAETIHVKDHAPGTRAVAQMTPEQAAQVLRDALKADPEKARELLASLGIESESVE